MEEIQANRSHSKTQAGVKFQKKKAKKQKKSGTTPKKGNNPKAFSVYSAHSRNVARIRNADLEMKKLHPPMISPADFSDTTPPTLIAIMGPPQVGKTTLIQCLVKYYTKQTVSEIKGPISVVSGKKKRLTFVECPNDLNAMVDIAKIADLLLLLIDASFGFEMETFEFLNIAQIHGFPKVMGVLTHLDVFKSKEKLKKTKKKLKHRFWAEIYQGAKLFYFSGFYNGKYPSNEVLNLVRFISVVKFRPLIWRSTHPGVLVDRVEDLTKPEKIEQDKNCERTVAFYGYVRGTNLKPKMKV